MVVVQNLLQIWMPKVACSLYLTPDNIKCVFFNFRNFDFTEPLRKSFSVYVFKIYQCTKCNVDDVGYPLTV